MLLMAFDRRPLGLRPSDRTVIPSHVRYRGNRPSFRLRRETRLVMILRIVDPGLSPKLTGGLDGVDAGVLPPDGFITDAVHQSMMDAAERHRELVAHLAAERAWLHESQVVRIRRFARTQEARLPGDKSKVLFVAVAPGRAYLKHALVDPARRIGRGIIVRAYILRTNRRSGGRIE